MNDIIEFFQHLFMTESWPARWVCGKWTEFHGWLYILSNLAIWGAYFTIPAIIILFIRKRRQELPFIKIFWLFILFILACGTTHLIDAAIFWYPAYRLSGFLLFATAIISWTTVFFLVKSMPQALSLKTPAQFEKIIQERTKELEESNKHQQKLNQDLDHFVYSASHDLKSPVNNIEGLMMLLKMELEQQRYSDSVTLANKIDFSLSRIKKTINGLTDILKVQRNPYEDTEQLDFEELLKEILVENEELIQSSNAKIIPEFNVKTLNYSKTGLKSILYNLLTNAIKYRSNRRQAIIHLRTFLKDGATVFAIEDNGLGIDLGANKEKIFTIFKRFHDHVEGSGMGLYMIKRLIEDSGGSIEVSSQVDKGTLFTVLFKTP